MAMEHDVIIAGAGCAGLSTAISALHTTPDLNVLILEKRSKIGEKGCSGGISSWLIRDLQTNLYLDRLDDALVSKVRTVKLISPGGTEVVVDGEKIGINPLGLVYDRSKFDNYLANTARSLGAKIITSQGVTGYEKYGDGIIVQADTMKYSCKYLVGADGCFSKIAELSGLVESTPRENIYTAVEYYFKRPDTEPTETITLRFDERYAPGGYVWHFPHGDFIKVGNGVPISIGHPQKYLDKYISIHFPMCQKVKTIGGCLPTAKPLETCVHGNIALVGDSARMCDSLTGGGLATSMQAGRILGEVIGKGMPLTEYDHLWRKSIGKLLNRRYKLKKMLYSLKQGEIDNIAETLAGYQVKSANPRREITKGLLHVLVRHPKVLWRYLRA